jgi:DNA-binding MarR family transcriptional regulator
MANANNVNNVNKPNAYQQAMVNIISTSNWIIDQQKRLLEKSGLTLQQFNILRILEDNEEALSTLQIRQRMLDNMSDTSRIVDRLVTKGLVKKGVSKTDKRLVDVTITAKGRGQLQKVGKGGNDMMKIVNSISEGEAKSLNKYLAKIRAAND